MCKMENLITYLKYLQEMNFSPKCVFRKSFIFFVMTIKNHRFLILFFPLSVFAVFTQKKGEPGERGPPGPQGSIGKNNENMSIVLM